MAVDLKGMPAGLINELLEDVRAELPEFLAFEKFAKVKKVDKYTGSFYRWDTPVGVASKQQRKAKVARDAPTPLGNLEMGDKAYKCGTYKWGNPIPESALDELETVENVRDDLMMNAAQQALTEYNEEIARVLKGQDSVETLTQKTCTDWTNATTGTPIFDIDDVVKRLRGGGKLIAVMGYDVALALSVHPQVTGAKAGSGREYGDFQLVRETLAARRISEVYIDGTAIQSGEPNAERNYAGVYDGVMYIGTASNLIAPQFRPLSFKVWEDPDKDVFVYKQWHEHAFVRSYAENGYYLSGILG